MDQALEAFGKRTLMMVTSEEHPWAKFVPYCKVVAVPIDDAGANVRGPSNAEHRWHQAARHWLRFDSETGSSVLVYSWRAGEIDVPLNG